MYQLHLSFLTNESWPISRGKNKGDGYFQHQHINTVMDLLKVHAVANWQKMYSLPYQQTTEQLHSSDRETPQAILNTLLLFKITVLFLLFL